MFSIGTMEIVLPARQFVEGQPIEGSLRYMLKRAVPAKGLYVRLHGWRRVAMTRISKERGMQRSTQRETVYDFEDRLAGEDLYEGATIPFSLRAPQLPAPGVPLPEGWVGDALRMLSHLAPIKTYPIQWTLHARLVIPLRFNLKDKIDIEIAPAPKASDAPADGS